jgi:hypothetical protein
MAKSRKLGVVGRLKRSAKRAGRSVDSLFGMGTEYRKSLGFRNPAIKRKLYRAAYLAGAAHRRNPGSTPDASVSLAAAERTALFREAAVDSLAAAREFYLAGYLDGMGEQSNPTGVSKFEKCVREVEAKGGAYDSRAVCAAAGRKKLGQAEMTRRSVAGKKLARKNGSKRKGAKNPRNPLDTAQEAYRGFHGHAATKTTVLEDRENFHSVVWSIGELVKLFIKVPADRRQVGLSNIVELAFDFEISKPTFVTANESRNQIFFDGGDQRVDLKLFGIDPKTAHEEEVLGQLTRAWYFTNKTHLGAEGGRAVYKHKFGEEGGELPTVLYRVRDERLRIAGGSYTIPDEGIRD